MSTTSDRQYLERLAMVEAKADRDYLQKQVEKLTARNNRPTMFLIGTITKIEKSKGNMYILTLKDLNSVTTYRVQCWGYANEQIINNEFEVGSIISCSAYVSYYDVNGTDKISIKTESINSISSLMTIHGTINSEWFKGKGIDPNFQVFTVKDANNNGKMIHCYLRKTSTLMRNIKKGVFVKVTGCPTIKVENDKSHRLVLNVTNLEIING